MHVFHPWILVGNQSPKRLQLFTAYPLTGQEITIFIWTLKHGAKLLYLRNHRKLRKFLVISNKIQTPEVVTIPIHTDSGIDGYVPGFS